MSVVTEPNIVHEQKLRDKRYACNFYDVHIATLDRWIAAGKIAHFKLGRRVMFSDAQLAEFLAQCERPARARKQRTEKPARIEVG
jgi:excisionase family DNA binding protein